MLLTTIISYYGPAADRDWSARAQFGLLRLLSVRRPLAVGLAMITFGLDQVPGVR